MPLPDHELSEREQEILRLVATGASNKEIAQRLFISANTVKVHLRNIFGKIGANSRTEAAMYAVNAGLVSTPARLEELPVLPGQLETSTTSTRRRKAKATWWLAGTGILVVLASLVLGVRNLTSPKARQTSQKPAPTISPRWKEMPSLPAPRSSFGAVAIGTRVYIVGGDTEGGVSGEVLYFDTQTTTWEKALSKPTPVADIHAAAIGGRIYVPGGRTASGAPANNLEIYDPELDAWTSGAPMPSALSAYALAAFEGRLFLFGGWDGHEILSSVYEYDPRLDAWSVRTNMPTARAFGGAASAGGRIYVLGGFDGRQALDVNEIYIPSLEEVAQNRAWVKGGRIPDGRYAMGVTGLADIVYLVGGEGQASAGKTMLSYFPRSDEWQYMESLVLNTWTNLGLVGLETEIFVMGGKLDGEPTDQNLSYQAIFTVLFPVIR